MLLFRQETCMQLLYIQNNKQLGPFDKVKSKTKFPPPLMYSRGGRKEGGWGCYEAEDPLPSERGLVSFQKMIKLSHYFCYQVFVMHVFIQVFD